MPEDGVGDDQAGGRDGVDPTEHQPGDHELKHPRSPFSRPLFATRSRAPNGGTQPRRIVGSLVTSSLSVLSAPEHRIPDYESLLAGCGRIRFHFGSVITGPDETSPPERSDPFTPMDGSDRMRKDVARPVPGRHRSTKAGGRPWRSRSSERVSVAPAPIR